AAASRTTMVSARRPAARTLRRRDCGCIEGLLVCGIGTNERTRGSAATASLDELHAQVVQRILQQRVLVGIEIAAGLLAEDGDDVDELAGPGQVDARLTADR